MLDLCSGCALWGDSDRCGAGAGCDVFEGAVCIGGGVCSAGAAGDGVYASLCIAERESRFTLGAGAGVAVRCGTSVVIPRLGRSPVTDGVGAGALIAAGGCGTLVGS